MNPFIMLLSNDLPTVIAGCLDPLVPVVGFSRGSELNGLHTAVSNRAIEGSRITLDFYTRDQTAHNSLLRAKFQFQPFGSSFNTWLLVECNPANLYEFMFLQMMGNRLQGG